MRGLEGFPMRGLLAGSALFALLAWAPQGALAADESETEASAEATGEDESGGDEESSEPAGYASTGIYSAHHALYALSNITNDGGAQNDDSFGADFRVGYRAHERAAAELQWEWTDRFDESIGGVTTREFRDNWTLTLNGKVFALTGRWQPYALVGFGLYHVNEEFETGPRADTDDHQNDGVGRFGVGVDLYGDETIAINLEAAYVKGFGSLDDLDYVSFGWGFQFKY
jgi:opacity protein-like surface antigen